MSRWVLPWVARLSVEMGLGIYVLRWLSRYCAGPLRGNIFHHCDTLEPIHDLERAVALGVGGHPGVDCASHMLVEGEACAPSLAPC